MARGANKDPLVLDYETKGIMRRPDYPPKPVGVSLLYPGKRPEYFAWGHPIENNCEEWQVIERLKDIRRSGVEILCHHAKFDLDVAEVHHGIELPRWDLIHDTMYQIFLDDPHGDLSLKPAAARILDLPPDEQDEVKNWILTHKRQIEQDIGHTFKPSEWGAYICMAPGKLVGKYANGDTSRTLGIHRKLMPQIIENGMLEAYNRERELMPIMLENERQGLRVNSKRLHEDVERYSLNLLKADEWLRKRLKTPGLDMEKDAKVAEALKRCGVVTQFVQTPTGKDSVSKKNLTPDMFHDKKVAQVLGYRNRLKTCLSTFMLPWAALEAPNKGWIHTYWNQVRSTDRGSSGARTGRMSCTPNFMNIPTEWYEKGDGYVHPTFLKIDELPMVRSYVIGDGRGDSFGGRDYNQQELRILAHFEDDELMRAYQENPLLDTHYFVQQHVQELLQRDIPRKTIKEVNFGTIYGQGIGSLAEKLGESFDTIKMIKGAQLRALPGLKSLNEGIIQGARNDVPIRTWGGRIYYKEPPMLIRGRMVDFSYKLLNYLVQGSAADCTKQAVINYHAIKKNGRFLAQVHDEINISAPTKAMKAELLLLREAMIDVKFDVPMLSEAYMGPSWGEVVKYKEAE